MHVADKSIRAYSLYRRRSWFSRPDTLPFAALYLCLWYYALSSDDAGAGKAAYLKVLIAIPLALLVHVTLFLSCQWSVGCRCWVGFVRVLSVDAAEAVRVVPAPHCGREEVVTLQRKAAPAGDDGDILLAGEKYSLPTVWFDYQKTLFIYDAAKPGFERLRYPTACPFADYARSAGYATDAQLATASERWGLNVLDLPSPTFGELFHEHVTAPFFAFQVLCVILWSLDEYWYYSLFTLIMLVIFESTVCLQRLSNLDFLRSMRRPAHFVYAYRWGGWYKVSSEELLPGDLVSLTARPLCAAAAVRRAQAAELQRRASAGGIAGVSPLVSAPGVDGPDEELLVPCDLLLLRGACVVNEAMLTGESMPQVKESAAAAAGTLELTDGTDALHRRHVVLSGTKLVQHSQGETSAAAQGVPATPDQGCLCFVLRTGFETSQGRLMKTILFASDRITAGSGRETAVFIGILLLLALAAATYVLHQGMQDPVRNRFKLVLHCIMIVTSVVPPELPMELSLAVTNSLAALQQVSVFCTEPFRIPLAGKVDTCCFDKTGTLTSDSLVLKGVAGAPAALLLPPARERGAGDKGAAEGGGKGPPSIRKALKVDRMGPEVLRILGGCHSLVALQGSIAGDPLEAATLEGIRWKCGAPGYVLPSETAAAAGSAPLRIHHTFAFDATLRRMSTVVGHAPARVNITQGGSTAGGAPDKRLWVVCKGAPEEMEPLFVDAPEDYRAGYLHHMGRGRRVLALGYRELPAGATPEAASKWARSKAECELHFAGLLVLNCPLKPHSAYVLRELQESSHATVMITGDSALTAADVGRQVGMFAFPPDRTLALALARAGGGEGGAVWRRLGSESDIGSAEEPLPLDTRTLASLAEEHALCVTGDVLAALVRSVGGNGAGGSAPAAAGVEHDPADVDAAAMALLSKLCRHVSVFARVSPDQKELVLAALNAAGRMTLMCGDGTNDVGALKRAHAGVSIINSPELEKRMQVRLEKSSGSRSRRGAGTASRRRETHQSAVTAAMAEMHEQQLDPTLVRMGDASIASPFTARTTSIDCVLSIVRQGRCTLVTTMQVYKILALNCLTSAYMLSSLYLWGVKQGDTQMTVLGLLIAALFFATSRAQPLTKLSKRRPSSRIFCMPMMASIAAQFVVHLTMLLALTRSCAMHVSPDDPSMAPDGPFRPNAFNSAVYLLSGIMQVNTFTANYTGHPFMQSLSENTLLYYMLMTAYAVFFGAAAEAVRPLNNMLELSPLPDPTFRAQLILLMAADTALSLGVAALVDAFEGRAGHAQAAPAAAAVLAGSGATGATKQQ